MKRKSDQPTAEAPKKIRTDEGALSDHNTSVTSSPKKTTKRRPSLSFGKENSPSKKTPKSPTKMSIALSFSRLDESFKNLPKTSSPKTLKQAKLSFGNTTATKHKKVQEKDTDATFCEALEKKKKKKSDDGWMSKSVLEKSGEALPVKKKKTSPNRTVNNNQGLFVFQQPTVRHSLPITQTQDLKKKTEDLEETPDISEFLKDKKIKEEKLSESDLDIFGSDGESSRGSSIICIEVPNDEPITIPENTVHSDDSLLLNLEQGFLNQPQFEESSSVPPDEPPRRRKRTYGECADCREFYSNYAGVYGATQAEEYIRPCPQKCKAFNYKTREAQPKIPRPSPPPPHLEPYTPKGFWEIPFTPEDPDQTQDGL